MAGPVLIPAASVLLIRDPLEVLMILRHENRSFVPNAWVFPGGAVDAEDGPVTEVSSFERAARREVREETSIDLRGELVLTSRWITPEGLPKRFDTWFFLASVPPDLPVTLQESEAVDYRWIHPEEALRESEAGRFPMVFPTIRNLEAIAGFKTAGELMAARRGARIEAIQPLLIVQDGRKKIVLP